MGPEMESQMFRLSKEEPAKGTLPTASVAIVIDFKQSPSILLIKRAERSGDPWSGQIAFPGGKSLPGEEAPRKTAVRETFEELGVDLDRSAEFLGYSGPFTTHTGTMDVTAVLFKLKDVVDVRPNAEVASFKWVDVSDLKSVETKSEHRVSFGGKERALPAIKIGDYVVWGLTHRILETVLVG